MVKNFRFQIILRIALVTGLIIGTVYFFQEPDEGIKAIFMGVFSLLAIVSVIRYVDRTNYEVSGFLNAMLYDDHTNKYSNQRKGKSFRALYRSFNAVNEKMNRSGQAEESQYLYLVTLVSQLQIGIISYDEKERLGLSIEAMRRLLDTSNMKHLKNIRDTDETLYQAIISLPIGRSRMVKLRIRNQPKQWSVSASKFYLRGHYYKLISIQDIKGEIEQAETEAWQKLIRVLTHEIMNSISLITSLSDYLLKMTNSSELSNPRLRESLLSGLEAINDRSKVLTKFTRNYRELTRAPLPQPKNIDGHRFCRGAADLFAANLPDDIRLTTDLPETAFSLNADPDLMNQVLLNLLKNAHESIEESKIRHGKINLSVDLEDDLIISVCDNAGGIAEENMDKIFIPFYTSKSEGSGIGLSLVKQIVRAHNAEITATNLDHGACFVIRLVRA